MPSLINTLMGAGNESQLNDVLVANDMLASAKAGAAAYLMATLESATPEVRSLLFANVSQLTQAHQGLTELALKKGWYQPYQSPDQQLSAVFTYSQTAIQNNA